MPEVKPELPSVSDAESYGRIAEGGQYILPTGKIQEKPYTVNADDPSSYRDIPDGRMYRDPKGVLRTKPTYQPISDSAQTLFDMANTVDEQEAVLAKFYGKDNIKRDPVGDPYVVGPGDQKFKPGRGGAAITGAVASQVLPVGGAMLGEVVGNAAGTLTGGPIGLVGGGIAGSAAGSTLGQEGNNLILRAAGVYDQNGAQEFHQLVGAAQGGAFGSGIGRTGGLVAGGAAKLASTYRDLAPAGLRAVLGADPDKLRIAAGLAEQGVPSWPSGWATHTPILGFYEAMSRRFRFNPVKQGGKEYYERTATDLLDQLGVSRGTAGRLTEGGAIPGVRGPAAVDTAQAGQTLKDRMGRDMAVADGRLEMAKKAAEMAARERAAGTTANADQTYQQALKTLQDESNSATMAAQKIIDDEFQSMRIDNRKALEEIKAGQNPGDLARFMSRRITTLRAAIMRRARLLYDAADNAAGDEVPDISAITEAVDRFRAQLPKDIKDNRLGLVIMLDRLAAKGRPGTAGSSDQFGPAGPSQEGEEHSPMTFGQLRMLRTMVRDLPNWANLDPSFTEGVYKYFAGKIDKALHDSSNSPGIKRAAALLDEADEFYAKNMAKFRDADVQRIVDSIQAGLPPNPGEISSMAMRGGWDERMTALRKAMGPQGWKAVQAADMSNMIQKSLRTDGSISGKAFAQQVEERVRNGVLEGAYDTASADRLRLQANRVLAHGGDQTIVLVPGDTLKTAMDRFEYAQQQIKAMAQANPERVLRDELAKAQRETSTQARALTADRQNDPLKFLAEPSVGAVEASNRILRSPDLMKVIYQRYGSDSPEWLTIRNVAARQILQDGWQGSLSKELSGLSEESQRMLFPGQAYDDIQTLAKNMRYLLDETPDMGASLATAAGVTHPAQWLGHVFGPLGKAAKVAPGFVGRAMIEMIVANFAKYGTNTGFIRYAARGLDGSPAQREATKEFIKQTMISGGRAFSGAGAAGANMPPGFDISDPKTYGGSGTPVQP